MKKAGDWFIRSCSRFWNIDFPIGCYFVCSLLQWCTFPNSRTCSRFSKNNQKPGQQCKTIKLCSLEQKLFEQVPMKNKIMSLWPRQRNQPLKLIVKNPEHNSIITCWVWGLQVQIRVKLTFSKSHLTYIRNFEVLKFFLCLHIDMFCFVFFLILPCTIQTAANRHTTIAITTEVGNTDLQQLCYMDGWRCS